MLYRVTQPLMLHPGALLLGLTEAQVAARTFALTAEGERWRVHKPVGFKAGEVLDIEPAEAVPKALAQSLQPAAAAPVEPVAERTRGRRVKASEA